MKREFSWRDYDEFNKWLQDVLETLTEKNENQANMLQKIFNIVYSDDVAEKQVKQVRDVLLGSDKE